MQVNPNIVKASALVAGGLVVGGGAGYFLAKSRFESKYRALADDEIDAYKDAHDRRNKRGVYSSPTTALEVYNNAVGDLGYSYHPGGVVVENETLEEEHARIQAQGRRRPRVGAVTSDLSEDSKLDDEIDATITAGQSEVQRILAEHGLSDDPDDDTPEEAFAREDIVQNIFNTSQEAMKQEIIESRTPHAPYVIAIEEYMEGKDDFEQSVFTYYEGDNTVTDEQDSIMPDFEEVLGAKNLSLFGHESQDENVVYIRNEKLSMDFEILRVADSYAELHGISDDDYTDKPPKIRKMRNDRDG